MGKKVLAVAGCCTLLIVALICGYFYVTNVQAEPADWTGKDRVTVTLTKDGFEPKHIYVSRGTVVTFATSLGVPFWPASDLHPFHTIYPAFDPRKPVPASETWTFTFNKDGHWNYHDHIGLAIGSIVVVPPGEKGNPTFDVLAPCDQKDQSGVKACWKEHIDFAFEKKGIPGAYAEFSNLYVADKKFRNQCHAYAHDLGLLASHTLGDAIPSIPQNAYCGSGFFHGYMEGFLAQHKGNMDQAIAFCKKVGAQISKEQKNTGPQCVHGIGHGMMEYLLSSRPDLSQHLETVLTMGLDACSRTESEDDKFRCASGVYAVFKDWVNIQNLQQAYPHIFSTEEPFVSCKKNKEEWERAACAWEMAKEALILNKYDFKKTFATEIRTAKEWDAGKYLPLILTSSSFLIGETSVEKDDAAIAGTCSSITEPVYKESCIQGLIGGLLFNGEPGNEIPRSAQFCTDASFAENEKTFCANRLITMLKNTYGETAKKAACAVLTPTILDIQELCR